MSSTNTPSARSGQRQLLAHELEKVLPKAVEFQAHHISTPPTVTEALCHPPALPSAADPSKRRSTKAPKTYCEKHFLAISIRSNTPTSTDQVLVLGIEIYIYTTAFSTIIFVAKADSTGYLASLNLPQGTPSPIREVTAAFVKFLVDTHHRHGTQLVVNLFARSQDQYLFPGSIKNKGKHVLDDRGLIKWWCRVLNGLLEENGIEKSVKDSYSQIHGYLVIPGLDNYETRAFVPRTSNASANWTLGHPLERISPYVANPDVYGESIPARCLIPAFPDDPKARFVEELEEATPEKLKTAGKWKGPQDLDQFWEMMAFRQECSSGRMTGFIWVVSDPVSSLKLNGKLLAGDDNSKTRKKNEKDSHRKKMRGPIRPRAPKVKTTRGKFPKKSETPHYFWAEAGRGQVILDDDGYKRAVELLLHLEFKDLTVATTSTARWLKESNTGKEWSLHITGQRELPTQLVSQLKDTGTVNNLAGLLRKKRSAEAPSNDAVAILDSGLIRKKKKKTEDTAKTIDEVIPPEASGAVNVLSTGLVRKKAKPS